MHLLPAFRLLPLQPADLAADVFPFSVWLDMETLPLRVERRLARLLGIQEGDLTLVQGNGGKLLPTLHCTLERPVTSNVSLVLRVHARTGVPLAHSAVELCRGDRAIEACDFTILAMEGYSHLRPAERRSVEERIWSRRAYATASTA